LKQQILASSSTTEIYQLGDSFELYGDAEDNQLALDKLYVIDDPVIVNEHDEDVFPDYIVQNQLWLACYGSIMVDVISLVLEEAAQQQTTPSLVFLVDALNYYLDNDSYLDFPQAYDQ